MKKYLKSLIGFPVGAMMLIISYIIVYWLDGKEQYIIELSMLVKIKYLISQLIYSGIIYTIIFSYIIMYSNFIRKYFKNITWKALFKFISATFILAVLIPLLTCIPDINNSMSGNVGTVVFGTSIIILLICGVCTSIYQSKRIKNNEKIDK